MPGNGHPVAIILNVDSAAQATRRGLVRLLVPQNISVLLGFEFFKFDARIFSCRHDRVMVKIRAMRTTTLGAAGSRLRRRRLNGRFLRVGISSLIRFGGSRSKLWLGR